MISSETFRAGMARLGAPVCVISTDGAAGRYGVTASAVTSLSDDPPSLLVCINRASAANACLKGNGRLCVNVLSCDQQPVGAIFARSGTPPHERFAVGSWQNGPLGNPRLRETAASFDCEIDKTVEYGTHSVFFCLVRDVELREDLSCLVYQGRAFHQIRHD